MNLLRNALRKWRAKGHGIHSPFAYGLITDVLHSPYAYNAFSDIENLLSENNIHPECIGKYHHLSFRLVHHFKPKHILEIGSGKGINTLFLAAAHPDASITCIENNEADSAVAKHLLAHYHNTISFKKALAWDNNAPYDAVFIHTAAGNIPQKEMLFDVSTEQTFWVFHPARQSAIKPLVRNIVKDKRVRVAFDMKQTMVLFLHPSYDKATYYI